MELFYFWSHAFGKSAKKSICSHLASVLWKPTKQREPEMPGNLTHTKPGNLQNLVVNGFQSVQRSLFDWRGPLVQRPQHGQGDGTSWSLRRVRAARIFKGYWLILGDQKANGFIEKAFAQLLYWFALQ